MADAKQIREALESMVNQYAVVDSGKIHTGGMSALEEAFDALGIDDPSPAPSHLLCDEPGCGNANTCGFPGTQGYRRTCSEHVANG